MEEKLKQVKNILSKYGQEQLLDAYYRMEKPEEKEKFLNDILNINFSQIEELYKNRNNADSYNETKIEPIEYVNKSKLSKKEYEEYEKIGTQVIKENKLAVVTMAGGQGTRLGHSGPKGTFDLGLPNHKSIFEILTDTLKKARKDRKSVV